MRPVVDALRPELPSSLGCVIDAALTADNVALGIGADRAFTVVIASRIEPSKCPALSKLESGLWIATLGGATPAASAADSVLASDRFVRARPYLTKAPIALASVLKLGSLIATASPEPLEAWLAFDTSDTFAPLAEAWLRDQLRRVVAEPATAPFATVEIQRTGPQIVASWTHPGSGDLALGVRKLLAWQHVAAPPAPTSVCPAKLEPPVIACANGVFEVSSFTSLELLVLAAKLDPVIASGMVNGLRVASKIPPLGIEAGDILIAVNGRQLTSRTLLEVAFVRPIANPPTLTVQRVSTHTEHVLRFVARQQ